MAENPGLGGTADVVDYARRLSKRIIHLDPMAPSRASTIRKLRIDLGFELVERVTSGARTA
jgi:hypothetical protein